MGALHLQATAVRRAADIGMSQGAAARRELKLHKENAQAYEDCAKALKEDAKLLKENAKLLRDSAAAHEQERKAYA